MNLAGYVTRNPLSLSSRSSITLGLGPPEESTPPPAMHEVVRGPVDQEDGEREAP